MNTNIVTQRLAMADAPPHVSARIMIVLMAATLVGGLLATDAQARGGGHVGGFGGGFAGARGGGFGGMHMGGGFGGAHIGSHFGGTRMGSGFGFHGDHRHGGYWPGYTYGYDWGWDCSPYGSRSGWQRPNVCY